RRVLKLGQRRPHHVEYGIAIHPEGRLRHLLRDGDAEIHHLSLEGARELLSIEESLLRELDQRQRGRFLLLARDTEAVPVPALEALFPRGGKRIPRDVGVEGRLGSRRWSGRQWDRIGAQRLQRPGPDLAKREHSRLPFGSRSRPPRRA